MAIPSIAFIPSGFKASKAYSVLPTNGNADLDVARNSTANRINKDGLIEEMAINVPLLDYSDSTCPSLLLQPQSINLITYPLTFSDAYWTKTGSTVTSGQSFPSVDYPSGAFKLGASTSTSTPKYVNSSVVTVGGGTATITTETIYVKAGEITKIGLQEGHYEYAYVTFDLTNTVVLTTGGTGYISNSIKLLSNGWYRLSLTFTSHSSGTLKTTACLLDDSYVSGTPKSYAYAGVVGQGLYIYGSQVETLSYPTSLMLPVTEGSTTTRLKDEVSKSGLSSEINSVEGTLFVDIKLNIDTNQNILTLGDGSSSNTVSMAFSNPQVSMYVNSGGVSQSNFVYTFSDITLNNKIAIKYKENNFSYYVNGVKVSEDLSGSTFSLNTLDRLVFNIGYGPNALYGKIADLKVYSTALTDSELIALTTI